MVNYEDMKMRLFALIQCAVVLSASAGTYDICDFGAKDGGLSTESMQKSVDSAAIAAVDPFWVRVAAAGSSEEAKRTADFVCAGTNDQDTIQKAIDTCAKEGRNLCIRSGLYMIDAFREWDDGGPKASLRIPLFKQHFTIYGEKFFQAGKGTITPQAEEWRNGVAFYVRDSVWRTAGKDCPSVLRGTWTGTTSQNGSGLRIENLAVFLCDNQHPARCIDCRCTDAVEIRNMRLYGFGGRLMKGDVHPYKKFGPLKMPDFESIGITMTSGSNIPMSRYDNIVATGFGQAFQAGGEHVICNDCLGAKGLYGWTFGAYKGARGAHNHPIVLIKCGDEENVHMPLFADVSLGSSRHQSVTMLGFNFERMERLTTGGRLGDCMREAKPGTWCGRIEYTVMPAEGSRNIENFRLWEPDGSGSRFESRNLVHKKVGTSAERRRYHPHTGQEFFDTDLGKLLVCVDPAKRLWVDAMGAPADIPWQVARARLLSNDRNYVFVASHRGLWRKCPENSLAAYRAAMEAGADLVECDIKLSKDGVPVMSHDPTVDRCTEFSGKVSDFTLDELKKMRLREGLGGAGAVLTDETYPTFEEMLRLFRGRSMIIIDDPGNATRQVFELLAKYDMERQVVLKCHGSPDAVRARMGEENWSKAANGEVLFMPVISVGEAGKSMTAEMRERGRREYMQWCESGFVDIYEFDGCWEDGRLPAPDASVRFYGARSFCGVPSGGRSDGQSLQGSEADWIRLIGRGITILQSDDPEALMAWLEKHGRR